MYVSYVSSPTFSDVYNTNIVNQQFHGGRAKQAIDKKHAFGVSESLVESGLVQVQVAIQNSKSTLGRRGEALFSFATELQNFSQIQSTSSQLQAVFIHANPYATKGKES